MMCLRPDGNSTHSEPGLMVSATVASESSAARIWSKYAGWRFAPRRTLPESGASVPRMSLRSVVFPAPLFPIMPMRSPRDTIRSRSLTIRRSPKDLFTLRNSETSLPERWPAPIASFTLPERSRGALRLAAGGLGGIEIGADAEAVEKLFELMCRHRWEGRKGGLLRHEHDAQAVALLQLAVVERDAAGEDAQ